MSSTPKLYDLTERLNEIFGPVAKRLIEGSVGEWFDGKDFLVDGRRFNKLSKADGARMLFKTAYVHRAMAWLQGTEDWDDVSTDT